ncbi:MAG: DUF2961 domain-containing protein [Bryobacteraceae bacterium]
MKFRHLIYSSAIFLLLTAAYTAAGGDDTDLTIIRPATKQGTVSGLWLDRGHPEARQLLPNTTVVVAELTGPAVITNLRITTDQWMHSERPPRGLVLEIYFDGASEPAAMSPLPDFFADGSNGRAMNFSSRYLEKVPIAYNCYFRMPFRKSAKVQIRNDTSFQYMGYSMVEWEAQPNLDANTGYFHATWRRKGFYVTGETREEFFRVKGRGHVIGRHTRAATGARSEAGLILPPCTTGIRTRPADSTMNPCPPSTYAIWTSCRNRESDYKPKT